ncbi:MAG TPA: outer membrane beta-barrel protein [Gemmatimonadales bacterium]
MRAALVIAATALLVPASLPAQSPFSVEIGGGVAVPVQDFGNADLGTGFGFGANVRYRFQPHFSAYAGWEWHHFSAELAPDELDVEETGYTFGVRYEHPFGSERPAGSPSPAVWVRAGGTLAHFEVEDEAGDPAGDTDHGLGWEAGAGISWPITNRIAVTPGVRLRMLKREINMGLGVQDATLSYLAAGVGVVIGF